MVLKSGIVWMQVGGDVIEDFTVYNLRKLDRTRRAPQSPHGSNISERPIMILPLDALTDLLAVPPC